MMADRGPRKTAGSRSVWALAGWLAFVFSLLVLGLPRAGRPSRRAGGDCEWLFGPGWEREENSSGLAAEPERSWLHAAGWVAFWFVLVLGSWLWWAAVTPAAGA